MPMTITIENHPCFLVQECGGVCSILSQQVTLVPTWGKELNALTPNQRAFQSKFSL